VGIAHASAIVECFSGGVYPYAENVTVAAAALRNQEANAAGVLGSGSWPFINTVGKAANLGLGNVTWRTPITEFGGRC